MFAILPAALLFLGRLPLGFMADSEDQSAELIPALEKLTSYMEGTYQDEILDGFVGFAILSGWIKWSLKKWGAEPSMSFQCQQLERMHEKVSRLLEKSINVLQQSDSVFYSGLNPIINESFWKPPSSWNKMNPALTYPQGDNLGCNVLKHSDDCLADILGTRKGSEAACNVTPICKKQMTTNNCVGYDLSHQLFYFIVANQMGCTNKLFEEHKFYTDIFCARMMKINQAIEENNYQHDIDLFMQNIYCCALAGYSDFLKPKWLKDILTWQNSETGCFGKSGLSEDVRVQKEHRRVKRREKILKDGCFCHTTSMATAALGAFLAKLCPL